MGCRSRPLIMGQHRCDRAQMDAAHLIGVTFTMVGLVALLFLFFTYELSPVLYFVIAIVAIFVLGIYIEVSNDRRRNSS